MPENSTRQPRMAPPLKELWTSLRIAVPSLFLMRGTAEVPGAWSARGTDLDVLADGDGCADDVERTLLAQGFHLEWSPEPYRRRFCLRQLGSYVVNVDVYEAALWGPGFASNRTARELSCAEATLLRSVFDKHDLVYFSQRGQVAELPAAWQELIRGAPPGRAGAAWVATGLLLRGDVHPLRGVLETSLLHRLDRLVSGAPGLEVAVAGPDGSGKTTLVETLTAACPLPFRVVYMGGRDWRTPLMRRMAGKSGSTILRHVEQALRRLEGWRAARQGKVVLYERHPHEIEPTSGHPLMLLAAHALFATYRRPVDLAIVLTGNTDLMFARKGEHTPAHLRMLDERLRRVAARYSREVLTYDSTELPPTAVSRSVAEELIARYQRLNRG
jgi:hypothetical protein